MSSFELDVNLKDGLGDMIRIEVGYDIYGDYRPETRESPEEHPELEFTSITVVEDYDIGGYDEGHSFDEEEIAEDLRHLAWEDVCD